MTHSSGHIDVWNANTFVKTSEITTTGEPDDLECDRSGRVLFAGTSTALKAYFVDTATSGTNLNIQINNAVEIRWNSTAGSLYQVQWAYVLDVNTVWFNFGGQILGNGLTMSIFDTTRDSRSKFYRVQLVSP